LTGGRALTRKTPVKKNTKAAAPKPKKKSVKKPARKAAPAKAAPAKAKPKAKPTKKPAPKNPPAQNTVPVPAKAAPISDLMRRIVASLEDDKAEDIVTVDLAGRSSLCDAAVIASGRSTRHVMSIAEHLARRLKEEGYGTRPVTGAAQGDWALVDAGDVIVHVFRPEVREYYDLEGMWAVGAAAEAKRPKARQK
jgi:ribosome-associated protein